MKRDFSEALFSFITLKIKCRDLARNKTFVRNHVKNAEEKDLGFIYHRCAQWITDISPRSKRNPNFLLSDLQAVCEISGLSPNKILDVKPTDHRIEYVTDEFILRLEKAINDDPNKENIPEHFCLPICTDVAACLSLVAIYEKNAKQPLNISTNKRPVMYLKYVLVKIENSQGNNFHESDGISERELGYSYSVARQYFNGLCIIVNNSDSSLKKSLSIVSDLAQKYNLKDLEDQPIYKDYHYGLLEKKKRDAKNKRQSIDEQILIKDE